MMTTGMRDDENGENYLTKNNIYQLEPSIVAKELGLGIWQLCPNGHRQLASLASLLQPSCFGLLSALSEHLWNQMTDLQVQVLCARIWCKNSLLD